MTRRVQDIAAPLADMKAVVFLEQCVKLAAIALKFSAFVEHFSKCILHNRDLVADTDFSTQLFLQIRGCRQMVHVDMACQNPYDRQVFAYVSRQEAWHELMCVKAIDLAARHTECIAA